MHIPNGMTEDEVLSIIDVVAKGLARKFQFGNNDIDDMKQYARMYAIQGIEKYNPQLGTLQTFLWAHVRNRLFNLKRDTYERPNKPCLNCPLNAYIKDTGECTAYSDKLECSYYTRWYSKNTPKKNIMNPITLTHVDDEQENNMKIINNNDDTIDYNSIASIIDESISILIRPLWVKFQNGIKLNKADTNKLFQSIKEILAARGVKCQEKEES